MRVLDDGATSLVFGRSDEHEARLHHPVHEYTQRAAGVVAHDPPAEPHALVAGTGGISNVGSDVLELTALPADVDVERAAKNEKPKPKDKTDDGHPIIRSLVDVRICSAMPLLQEEIGHCSENDHYEFCVMDAMEKVGGHKSVLLRNLYAERRDNRAIRRGAIRRNAPPAASGTAS